MSIEEIQKDIGFSLPEAYITFLSRCGTKVEYLFDDYPGEEDIPANVHTLYDEASLMEVFDMARIGTVRMYRCLKLYTSAYQAFMNEDTVYSEGGDIPIQRVADGFVIGSEEDGDPLYLDPHNDFSVWRYFHDGGDVEKKADTFEEYLALVELAPPRP